MLIMTLAPPLAALFGYFILGESLNLIQIAGMIIVILGIAIAIFNRPVKGEKLTLKLSSAGTPFCIHWCSRAGPWDCPQQVRDGRL